MASTYVEVNKSQEDMPGVASVAANSPISSTGGANPTISINYTPVNQAGDTLTGALEIDGSADAVQLTVKGNATQTSNLQNWKNHSGTVLFSISGAGAATGTFNYTPTTPSDWAGSAPTTVKAALDRCATLLKTLNGGTGP